MTIVASHKYTLGVISCFDSPAKSPPFQEALYFKQLAQAGKQLQMHTFIFNPKEVDWSTRTVKGWHILPSGKWTSSVQPLPHLIYDRCFYANQKQYLSYKPYILRITQDPHIRLLGRPLSGKWQTYLLLKQNPKLLPFLPPTFPYRSGSSIFSYLQTWPAILLKPNGGSLGCGVIAILKISNGFLVRGRSKTNQVIQHIFSSKKQLQTWLQHSVQGTRYIIQPFLKLTTSDHRPFDVRILVQKNEKQQWETTGMAVRIGQPLTITSNLHGGGEALALQPFLDQRYSPKTVRHIISQMEQLTKLVPAFIEENHGSLLELGLDIGIDPQGKVWLLEVNSKPGRAIFLKTGNVELRQRAVELPIRYAHSLLTGGKAG
ncbi:YheC/YheD family endospore coat-associated protein [Thermoflavimicrobium dichotomicum]|uniref:YheC/D like ATP-grasp n=1 Tax=Thermoflavimicrobium dichotomicum TaxID=46223 RepID=A0A1I3LF05_9BACL|nr:YheC/YheD family protein [Thermoflavimicrobium dichotomicum]SFI83056.1 YheC/D like ATP-grasp [Thermoflavimicrobium dichotomicum]